LNPFLLEICNHKNTGMNQIELAQTIRQLSRELDTLVEASLEAPSISALDHELLKSKCVSLYARILELHTASPADAGKAPAPVTAPVPEIPPVTEELPGLKKEVVPPAPVLLFNDLIPAELPPVETPPKAEIREPVAPPPAAPEPEPIVIPVPLQEKTPTEIQNEIIDEIIEIREELKEQQKQELPKEVAAELSLHEKLANVIPKADLTDRFSIPLPSLKSAINVNLKIALVNELFNENTVEYVKAIDRLNTSENIHEAMRYFTELKHTYDWSNDNSLVKELETLITKRFS
jgi:hypothetical protein